MFFSSESEKQKFQTLNRFWPNTEKWTKVHKSVHEKVVADNYDTLLCTFLNNAYNLLFLSNHSNFWQKNGILYIFY